MISKQLQQTLAGLSFERHARILGAPGSGKTALLLAAAQEFLRRHAEGQQQSERLAAAAGVPPVMLLTRSRGAQAVLRDRFHAQQTVTITGAPVKTLVGYAFAVLEQHSLHTGEPRPALLTGSMQDVLVEEVLAQLQESQQGEREIDGVPFSLFESQAFRSEVREFARILDDYEHELAGSSERQLLSQLVASHSAGEVPESAGLKPETLSQRWHFALRVAGQLRARIEERNLNNRERLLPASSLLRQAAEVIMQHGAAAAAGFDPQRFIAIPELVLVDDSQDLEEGSLALLASLAAAGCTVWVTGDPDIGTGVYRGAAPRLLGGLADEFARKLPAEQRAVAEKWLQQEQYVCLTTVYRHGPEVREVAAALSGRIGTTIKPEHRAAVAAAAAEGTADVAASSSGAPTQQAAAADEQAQSCDGVSTVVAHSEAEQASFVATWLRQRMLGVGMPATSFNRMAVVCRSQAEVAQIAAELSWQHVPTRLVSGGVSHGGGSITGHLLSLLLAVLEQVSEGRGQSAFRKAHVGGYHIAELLTSDIGGLTVTSLRRLKNFLLLEHFAGGQQHQKDDANLPSFSFVDDESVRDAGVLAASEHAEDEEEAETLDARQDMGRKGDTDQNADYDPNLDFDLEDLEEPATSPKKREVPEESASGELYGQRLFFSLLEDCFASEQKVQQLLTSAEASSTGVQEGMHALARLQQLVNGGAQALASTNSLQQTLWKLWEMTGLSSKWQRMALASTSLHAQVASRKLDEVLSLFYTVKRFEERSTRHRIRDLQEFVLMQSELTLPEDTLAERSHLPAVTVTTPQGTVGEEYDYVVVIGPQEGRWPNLRMRGSVLGSYQFEQMLRTGLPLSQSRAGTMHDETKLLLQAITRARKEVLLVGVETGTDTPSTLFRFIADRARKLPEPGPLTLVGQVAMLRERITRNPRDIESLNALAVLADAGVPGAHPSEWYGVLPPSTCETIISRLEKQESGEEGSTIHGPDGEELPGHVNFGPTALTSIEQCPLDWVLYQITGSTSTANMQLGTIIHYVLQKATHSAEFNGLLGEHPVSEGELFVLLVTYMHERWHEIEFESEWQERSARMLAERMLANMCTYLIDASKNCAKVEAERKFEIALGAGSGRYAPDINIHLVGIADRIEHLSQEAVEEAGLQPGAARIIDLKTSSTVITQNDAISNLQLLSYRYFWERSGELGEGEDSLRPRSVASLLYVNQEKPTLRSQQIWLDHKGLEDRIRHIVQQVSGSDFLRNEAHCLQHGANCASDLQVIRHVSYGESNDN